jgi:hypothetical protein
VLTLSKSGANVGKLYDRRDLEFDLHAIDDLEAGISRQVLAGTFPACKVPETVRLFEKERQRCKMQLLRTGQLISDLTHAMRLFRMCPHCATTTGGKQLPCSTHKLIVHKAKQAVHFAAEDNLARRMAAGQMRSEDDDSTHDGSSNQWETLYWADRRNKVWPGQSRDELEYNREQFGSLDYRGWLEMMRWSAEEISETEYSTELARLREGQQR